MRVPWDCRPPTGRRNTVSGAPQGGEAAEIAERRQEGSQCHLRQPAHQAAAGLAKAGRRGAGGRAGLGQGLGVTPNRPGAVIETPGGSVKLFQNAGAERRTSRRNARPARARGETPASWFAS